ncbi:MAG: hypothetical protein AAF917_02845, partial [Pseudomonadota bacterium]
MEFKDRTLKPYTEPVSASTLQKGELYFSVQYLDDEMCVPTIDTLVFVGRETRPGDSPILYFQDAESYRDGVRIDNERRDQAQFLAQPEDQLSAVFTYEKALDQLMACSIRRRKQERD